MPYPITFLITDLISEIYGKKKANQVVTVGIFAAIFSILIVYVADLMPAAQFGTYKKGDFYDWHYDVNWESDRQYDRKLSIVIQLSNPNDYEGGVFEFQHPFEQPKEFKERGSVLIFPSYITPHQGLPIETGNRYLLVFWLIRT